MKIYHLILPLMLATGSAQAGELVYRPINPSFGGDPLAGNYLLNKAQSQDTNVDPDAPDFGSFSESDFFIQDLRADLLNTAIEDALDNPDAQGGAIIDSATLDIRLNNTGNGFNLDIRDKATGEVTTIRLGQSALQP